MVAIRQKVITWTNVDPVYDDRELPQAPMSQQTSLLSFAQGHWHNVMPDTTWAPFQYEDTYKYKNWISIEKILWLY